MQYFNNTIIIDFNKKGEMLNSKKEGIDHGLTLPYKCTSCNSSGLNLKEYVNHTPDFLVKFFYLITGGNRPSFFFQYNNCNLMTFLSDDEVDDVLKVNKAAQKFYSGEYSKEYFLEVLSATDSKTIKEIHDRGNSWYCSECKNEVPPTFEVCWNCGAECTDSEILIPQSGGKYVKGLSIETDNKQEN